jgi:hypothetical protein
MSAPRLVFGSLPASSSTIPTFLVGPEAEEMEQVLSNKISERASLIFEQSGSVPGNDEANWLRAESEILGHTLELRESATWVTLNASIPTAGAGMQIVVKPKRAIVRAKETGNGQNTGESTDAGQGYIFLAANLPVEVDPSSAAASFRDNNLLLMIRKRQPDNLTTRPGTASK